MTHIWVSKLTIICSNDGFPPGRRQAIILINAVILSIALLGTNILIEIHRFSIRKILFENIICKMAVILSLELSVWIGAIKLSISFRIPSLPLELSYNLPSDNES